MSGFSFGGAPAPSFGGGGGGSAFGGGGFGGHPPPSELVPTWGTGGFGFGGGGGVTAVGQRHVMEIDTESLSDRTTRMEDTFTIMPQTGANPTPFLVASSVPRLGPKPGDSKLPVTPFGEVAVCDALNERLADPRVFALTLRLHKVFLEDTPFQLKLPHGAEPAALFACISVQETVPNEVPMTFTLSDLDAEDKPFFTTTWTPATNTPLPHMATMVGGLPSTGKGCLLRLAIDQPPEALTTTNGIMVRIVFRRGVNAPLYRFIGALSVIPPTALDDGGLVGVERLVVHLAHTLPQEVVVQILDFYLPRASASDRANNVDYYAAREFSPWTKTEVAREKKGKFSFGSNSGRSSGAKFSFSASKQKVVSLSAESKETPEASTTRFDNNKSSSSFGSSGAPERQVFAKTTKSTTGFSNKPSPFANTAAVKATAFNDASVFAPRSTNKDMLALPGLKTLRIANYVSAAEVLAVPKWTLEKQRSRDAIVGTPMPPGTNFFAAPGHESLISALASADDEVAGMRYATSMSLVYATPHPTGPPVGPSTAGVIASREKRVRETLHPVTDAPEFLGYEVRSLFANGSGVPIELPIPPTDEPLLIVHNCGTDTLPSHHTSGNWGGSFRKGSGAAEIDGVHLKGRAALAGNVSCHWLMPMKAKDGTFRLEFAGSQFGLVLRILTPRCWKRLVEDGAIPAPPPSLEHGVPVEVDLPPPAIYRLAGVERKTLNLDVTLTATPLFTDKTEGAPIAGVIGRTFTAANLLGGRPAGSLEGVTVRLENLDMQLMRLDSGRQSIHLFGLDDFRAQTCITRILFDGREMDDGFKSATMITGACETETSSDQQQIAASSNDYNNNPVGFGSPPLMEPVDPAKAMNALKKVVRIVNFDDMKNRGGGGGGGGGWGAAPVPPPAPPAPFASLLFEARVQVDVNATETPHLRIKELVFFLANKDGMEQKIDGMLGKSAFL